MMNDDGYWPVVVVLSVRTLRARKEHECYICRKPIAVGESYKRTALLGDDRSFTEIKQHVSKDCYTGMQ